MRIETAWVAYVMSKALMVTVAVEIDLFCWVRSTPGVCTAVRSGSILINCPMSDAVITDQVPWQEHPRVLP